jgi:radical SAM protein with 4Fe4S-binding SPASM domain
MIPLFERLEIESQANCNRSCWFCPRTYDRSGKYLNQNGKAVLSRMPTVKILAILDEAAGMGFRGEVAFHYYSEPLLDERNAMLAGEAKQRGMQPYLHTNGDVLKLKPDLCDEIQGVYQRVAVGLYDFQTDDELEEAKSYWRRRLDRVDLSFSYIPLSRSGGARSIGVPRALAPSDARMAVPDFTYLNAPCHRPLLRMIIQYDGEMGNCCEDTHGAFGLGNIYRNTLKELWYSERHVKVVVDLVNGRRELFELCRICPMAPTGKSPLGDKINMEPRRLREVPVFRPGVA